MKNEATLGQVVKILSYLENIPSEQVQKDLIESGVLSDAIKNKIATSESDKYKVEVARVRGMWEMLARFTGGNNISITVPHVPYLYADDKVNKIQLRCWLGEHGYTDRTPGHVDSGSAKGELLFEIYIPAKLRSDCCPHCWPEDLRSAGIDIFLRSWDGQWVLENKGHYDIVFFRPNQPKS